MTIDLTLERVRRLASQFSYKRPSIHVAGTNGKGSVACLLASILRASSFKVGKFNSPHLISIYDCITINDDPVTLELYHECRTQVEQANEQIDARASSFELLTVTALLVFERAAVDIAIVEVGMGGRLDATNVIPDECILVSALTAVDLDHQAFLGATVDLITREKAAIARQGKPFILGHQRDSSVGSVAEEVVLQHGGTFVRTMIYPFRFRRRRSSRRVDKMSNLHRMPSVLRSAPRCRYTEHINSYNLSLALTVISLLLRDSSCAAVLPELIHAITPETVRAGIECASWPGRLSFHTMPRPVTPGSIGDPLVLLVDGAHNPASSEALASYISNLTTHIPSLSRTLHITYILALSHSPPKTPEQTLFPLLPPRCRTSKPVTVSVAVLRFHPPDGMPWVKSVAPSALRAAVSGLVPNADVWATQDDDPADNQLQRALEWTELQANKIRDEGGEHLAVLAGSLYLVADFYRLMEQLKAPNFLV
ncbi:Mur ligase [Pisolithus orientalis]|uniref:Mur ligase n=1 Tax=Pisolithus orientalis TaxID=936130 RepID=UPI0022246033|nr:Mur ligase [Pisolithus orientalis]KAI6030886.1 Mur ligase [Pisolithus orientalis]